MRGETKQEQRQQLQVQDSEWKVPDSEHTFLRT